MLAPQEPIPEHLLATLRRSRWSRAGTKLARLTEQDIEIFKLLTRYRYLRSSFIHAFGGGDKTRLVKRLSDLYRAPNCFFDRPAQQRQYANAHCIGVANQSCGRAGYLCKTAA